MTSQARIEANRRNARRSTGPCTAAGKARARHNARRHGLSVSVLADPLVFADVEQLAGALAGVTGDAARLKQARRFAEAEFELLRVRAARFGLMMADTTKVACEKSTVAGESPSQGTRGDADGGAEKILANLTELERLDRYEGRAMSRRKKALRALRG
jgi:hypothetical protein